MGESAKVSFALGGTVLLGIAAVLWFTDNRTLGPVGLGFRYGTTVFGAIMLGWVLWSMYRPDRSPDWLRRVSKGVLDKDGVSFALRLHAVNERPMLTLYWQNRYERDATTTVMLKPVGAGALKPIHIEVPGAGFGVVCIALRVPAESIGRTLGFEFGADVSYAGGRGRLLRFKDGVAASSVSLERERGFATMSLVANGGLAGKMATHTCISVSVPAALTTGEPAPRPRMHSLLWTPAMGHEPWSALEQIAEQWMAQSALPEQR